MLLSGKSADGLANAGPIVCACFGVGRNTICDAIAGGARSAADIGAKLKAGTNCGSCIPELKRLIAQAARGRFEATSVGRGELSPCHIVIARSVTTKQSSSVSAMLDCFALLAMTAVTISGAWR